MVIMFKSNDPFSMTVYILYFLLCCEMYFKQSPPNHQTKWFTLIIECMHPSTAQRLGYCGRRFFADVHLIFIAKKWASATQVMVRCGL